MLELIEDRVSTKQLHAILDSKKDYSTWAKKKIKACFLDEGKDYIIKKEDNGEAGRPSIDYLLTKEAAKHICIIQQTAKGKELRDYLLGLDKQKDNLELVTIKQAAYAVRVIEALQFISNQKKATELHKEAYFAKRNQADYADFHKYRADIIGWDKSKVEEAFNKWQVENKRTLKSLTTMNDRINAMDPAEAIKIAVLDILFSNDTDKEISNRFANMVKNLAIELKKKTYRENETNLLQTKSDVIDVKQITV